MGFTYRHYISKSDYKLIQFDDIDFNWHPGNKIMIVRDPRTVSGLNGQQIKQSIDPYSQQFMDGIVDGPVGKA